MKSFVHLTTVVFYVILHFTCQANQVPHQNSEWVEKISISEDQGIYLCSIFQQGSSFSFSFFEKNSAPTFEWNGKQYQENPEHYRKNGYTKLVASKYRWTQFQGKDRIKKINTKIREEVQLIQQYKQHIKELEEYISCYNKRPCKGAESVVNAKHRIIQSYELKYKPSPLALYYLLNQIKESVS